MGLTHRLVAGSRERRYSEIWAPRSSKRGGHRNHKTLGATLTSIKTITDIAATIRKAQLRPGLNGKTGDMQNRILRPRHQHQDHYRYSSNDYERAAPTRTKRQNCRPAKYDSSGAPGDAGNPGEVWTGPLREQAA